MTFKSVQIELFFFTSNFWLTNFTTVIPIEIITGQKLLSQIWQLVLLIGHYSEITEPVNVLAHNQFITYKPEILLSHLDNSTKINTCFCAMSNWWHSFLQRALYCQQSRQRLSSFLLFTNIASSICTPWRYPITSDDVCEFKITCTNDVTMSRNQCHHLSSTLVESAWVKNWNPHRFTLKANGDTYFCSVRCIFHIMRFFCTGHYPITLMSSRCRRRNVRNESAQWQNLLILSF